MKHIPTVALQEFCETGSGGTPNRAINHYYGGPIPWVKSGELREGVIVDSDETITELGLKESSAKLVPKGSILLAMYGATVGRMALLGIDAATNQAICNIRPDPKKADTRYLFHALQSKIDHFLGRAAGGAQPNISQGIIRETRIPLPPLDEQRRIAAILDKADTLRRKRKRSLGLLEGLTQSIFAEIFGDPLKSEANKTTISAVAERTQIGPFGSLLHQSDYASGGIPLINPMHIISGALLPSPKISVTSAKYDELRSYHLRRGDVVMGRRGEMGRCAEVKTDEKLLCGTGSLFIRPTATKILPSFLQALLSSPSAISYFEKCSAGATMANLNKNAVDELNFALPPIVDQRKFEKAQASVRAMLKMAADSEAKMDRAFSSLQHRAFSGQL